MFRSSSRKEGSWFTLSLLGCCSSGPNEDDEWQKKKKVKKVKRKCTELLNSASDAVCSCLDENGGSSASSYAYLPAAEYAIRAVPYINRYPNLVIPPDERFTVHHYYLRPPKKSVKVVGEQKHFDDDAVHDEEKDLNENPTLQKEEEEASSGESVRIEDESASNNNDSKFRRYFCSSVESVRAKVLKEHVDWRNAAILRSDSEEAQEQVEVEMPGVLREIEDEDEGYDEWKESRNAALERLAGKRGKK